MPRSINSISLLKYANRIDSLIYSKSSLVAYHVKKSINDFLSGGSLGNAVLKGLAAKGEQIKLQEI